jgi:hypothetical protein
MAKSKNVRRIPSTQAQQPTSPQNGSDTGPQTSEGGFGRFQAKQIGVCRKGLATSYPEQDTPASYAHEFTNIFINAEGSLEKRPGLTGMYALVLASGQPSALLDWNNNYGDDPDKGVVFHCSNLPKDVFVEDTATMDYQSIIAGTVGKENTYGTVVGRVQAKPFTFCRVSTDDFNGRVSAYLGQGELTKDPLQTFGGYGVIHVPNLQGLLKHICENGFEHHVAINLSQTADAVHEALSKYLGWDVYYHNKAK